MVLIEFKEAALNNAFEELDVAKKGLKKVKLALCNVEDSLCEMYESSKEYSDEDFAYDEYDDPGLSDGSIEIDYRRRRGMRDTMHSDMRHAMRMRMRGYGRYRY